jgi:hypothetical protein
MAYDLRTAGVPVISESSGLSTPTVLPAFGAPETLEALRDAVNELWNRMGVIAAHYQQTEYRYPERHVWEVLEALNIFNLTHGTTLPAARKDGTPLQAGDMHGDYSQPGIPLRPLIYDGENFVSFLLDIQPGGAMIDSLLSYLLVNLDVINAPNQALVDALRTELRDGATSAMDTFALVEAAIAALQALVEAVDFDSPAFTGAPTAPTAAPGTDTTQIATTAFANAAAAAAQSAAAAASVPLAQKGAASGVAELDGSGKVPAGQLPSYVDDVIEAADFDSLPGTGETGKIYVTLDDGKAFRWSGSAYIEIVASPGSTDALAEGATNKYFTDTRAQDALADALAGKQALLSGVADVPGLVALVTGKVDGRNVASYTAARALSGLVVGELVSVAGRTSAGDGGEGLFQVLASGTDDGGVVLVMADSKALRRVGVTKYVVNWFGSSADWGAAFTAAAAATPSGGGVVQFRPGGDYLFTTQAYAKKSNLVVECWGAIIRPRFAGGPTFKFGDGTSAIIKNTILGGLWNPGSASDGGPDQPMWETRGLTGFRTIGVTSVNNWAFHKWGDAGDAVFSYQWWATDCKFDLRSNANGGHAAYGVQCDGSLGGYYATNTFMTGDAVNVAAVMEMFQLTAAQGPDRFDGFKVEGGNIVKVDYGIRAVDARIVNVDLGDTCRIDDVQLWAMSVEVSSGAAKGGCEDVTFNPVLGGFYKGGGLRVVNDSASITCGKIHAAPDSSSAKNSVVLIDSNVANNISEVTIFGVSIQSYDPDTTTNRPISISGTISGVLVDGINYTKKSGAANEPDYLIYNDTPSTASVRIGASIRANPDDFGTGVVYDPNEGNLAIGRYCALRPDGTLRRSHNITFTKQNLAAGLSVSLIGIDSEFVFAAAAPGRGRWTQIAVSLSQAVTADTLLLGVASGAAIHANLRAEFTSADGQYKVTRYPAGSAIFAEAAALQARVTTGASFTPTTLDCCLVGLFEEM